MTTSEEAMKYPIAEMFVSPQGEGLYTGAMMLFVRLAGCSVGKVQDKPSALLPVYTELCTTYDGREFYCDTDFRVKSRLTAQEILACLPEGVRHLCITGGEPLIHDLLPLVKEIARKYQRNQVKIHIETSGTIPFPVGLNAAALPGRLWITISPKQGVLDRCIVWGDEIKLLVDEGFDINRVPEAVKEHLLVWVQPINLEHTIDEDNLARCLELLKKYPQWRLSTQMHKIWKCR